MTVTSCPGKCCIFHSCTTLSMTDFRELLHAVKIAIKQQQYCNTVRPQLNSDRFTQHMTSQTWRLKRLFLNFAFNSFLSGQFVKLSFSFKMSGVYIFSWEIRPRYE